MTIGTLAEPKATLRMKALARRRALDPAIREMFSAKLREEGIRLAARFRAEVVSVFYPVADEPDTLSLLRGLTDRGVATALPVTISRADPLKFRRWRPGEKLVEGALKIPAPPPDAPEVDPDFLFVPLAAFDRRGHRIGYGAGYYDRALARLRAERSVIAVGVAYATSEIEAVPSEPHDQKLDFVLTENEVIDARDAL